MNRVPSWLSAFMFTLLVVSVLSSKTLHISQHTASLQLLYFIVYLPTLFSQDAVVVLLAYALFKRRRGAFAAVSNIAGCIFCAFAFTATAVQFGFYLETGSEVDWLSGIRFLKNPSGLKVLMSGGPSMYRAGAALVLVAALLFCLSNIVAPTRSVSSRLPQMTLKTPTTAKSAWRIQRRRPTALLPTMGLLFAITAPLQWTRPRIPYDHLSDSVPLAVLKAWHQVQISPGPGRQRTEVPARDDDLYRLNWLDDHPLFGLEGWLETGEKLGAAANLSEKGDPGLRYSHQHRYKPLDDPLKISNLDLDLLLPLQQAFRKSAPNITHVVLLTLESTRRDVFPIRQGTPIYERILKSRGQDEKDAVDKMLARLTPVALEITGESFWPRTEADPERQTGGITVDGAVTGSSYTVKSLLCSHCGVSPMPFDFLYEVEYDIYQPCLPHIFNLFNRVKGYSSLPNSNSNSISNAGQADVNSRPWTSAFVQSVETYAWGQDVEMRQMGFHTLVDAEALRNETAKHYPPKSPTISALGYAETELKPYLRDVVNDAAQNKKRLFLSHLTSTTHYPFDLPSPFEKKEYLGSYDGTDHTYFNTYLNALHYVDKWLGEVLDILDEAGMTNETLIVVVGDHGYTFPEDAKAWGVAGSPHVTAFQVPLVFRHPHLPQMRVSANASSMSILPTVLDLLIQSGSLDQNDTTIASALIKQYQGQSLLRPFRNSHDNRQAWNMAIVAPGGSLLAISSAAVPYRLIMPLVKNYEYRFTNLDVDPLEAQAIVAWSLDDLRTAIHDMYGPKASSWAAEAAEAGRWWVEEQDRLWNNYDEEP